MEFYRCSDGSYSIKYDGTKTDLLAVSLKIMEMAKSGVAKRKDSKEKTYFILNFYHKPNNFYRHEFANPRELWYFGFGLEQGINSRVVENLENNVKSIVKQVFKINELEAAVQTSDPSDSSDIITVDDSDIIEIKDLSEAKNLPFPPKNET